MNIKAFKSKTNKKERSQVESHTGESLWEVILIKIAVFDVKPYDITGLDRYGTENGIAFKYFETKLNIDTVGLAADSDGVCAFVNDDLSEPIIDRLCSYGVRLIALRCAGFNNVDIRAAAGKICVVRVPSYSPHAVAEHALAMLLTLLRKTHKAYLRTRDFNFSLTGLVGTNLYGKTAGVVGTGRIGRVFIDICRGLGMHVIAYDVYPAADSDIQYVTLDRLFAESDVISLHCPLTPETTHIINGKSLEKMKDGVILINTSRGALIDAEALLEHIKKKKIGGACLDVYEEESDIFFEDLSDHIMDDDVLARLISMPNVLVTSHQAFLTEDALDNIAKTTAENIASFFRGEPPKNEVK